MTTPATPNSWVTKALIRLGLLVVACTYFSFTLYWAIIGIYGSISYTSDTYVYNQLSQGPLWWMLLYYSSEGISGTVGIILRATAGAIAVYATAQFMRKKEKALLQIKTKLETFLLLEAGYILSFIPSVIASFAYFFSGGTLYYFDHTPELILLYVTGIPCLATVALITPLLLKLRAVLKANSPGQIIVRYASLTCIAYIFLVFWLGYSMAWLANMVPFWRAQEEFGWSFLLEPENLVCFTVTVIGLLAVAILALITALPAIRMTNQKISPKRIGITTLLFGSYFIFALAYFFLTGGYTPHPNVWYEVIGPPHNLNLWCISFAFLGFTILATNRATTKPTPQLCHSNSATSHISQKN